MNVDKIKEIVNAARVLGLPERATYETVKIYYRELIKKWHPDVCGKDKVQCREMIRKINKAYRVISNYIKNYKYPLSENTIMDEESYIEKRFGNDPIWS